MSPLDGDAMPRPKAAQLARGAKRYRRKVASPKQWQAIQAAKFGPCRVCCDPGSNGKLHGLIHLHHVVSREDFGDDVPENMAPLCPTCHDRVTRRAPLECRELLECLTDAEYAYMIARGGESYPERAYGIEYRR
jgi:5-methylcytosine-specific restriction endonuclease McrA